MEAKPNLAVENRARSLAGSARWCEKPESLVPSEVEGRGSELMQFWVYMLRCRDGRYYTGHTEDLDVRLAQHQQGYFPQCWTYKRRSVELVWCEEMPTREEALVAERIVGGWSRGKKEALIRGDWKTISHLARPPKERGGLACGRRFSTSLETSGVEESPETTVPISRPDSFVSSEVEKPSAGAGESA